MKVHHFLFSAICILLMASSCQKEPQVIKVESVALNTTSLTIVEGESQSLTATVSPSNADNKKVTWSSSNSSVATVDDRGTVTAVAAGTATITAKSKDGGKTATCSVTVEAKVVAVESVSLDKAKVALEVGETFTLTAKVSPDDATDKTVTWSSSDESIATVKEGVVTAIKVGSTTITAKAGDKTATCVVTIESGETINPFTITSEGNTSISIKKVGAPNKIDLEYRKVTGWSAYTMGNSIDLGDGEFVQFRAKEGNESFSLDDSNYYKVVVSGSGTVKLSGNIMSLLDKTENRTKMADYGFYCLFMDCNSIVDASKLKLPATTLAFYCYNSMFSGCTSLQTAPELPATKMSQSCYNSMFSGCTSLQTAPVLPATNLALDCYYKMFSGCTSLQTAPELPATTLDVECYGRMFSGCTSLQTAPELPATQMTQHCYVGMFSGCTSLQEAPVLPATVLAYWCYQEMFSGCTSLQTAPEISATRFYSYMQCCEMMFFGCSKLNYVKAMFLDKPEGVYTRDWLSGVSPTGTFVKSKNATWDVTGPNGIPEGWTVQIAE